MKIFATADGQLLASGPLLPDEVLLGVDAAGELLYVWSWRSAVLRVLAAEDRREVDRMPLEGMRPKVFDSYSPSLHNTYSVDGPRSHTREVPSERPLLRRAGGELLVIEGTWLRAYRPEGGEARLAWSVDLGGSVKGLWGLHLTDDGGMLYLIRREAPLSEPDPQLPSEAVALALPSGRRVGRVTGGGYFEVWGANNKVFATDTTYKWPLAHLLRIEGGHVRRRISSDSYAMHMNTMSQAMNMAARGIVLDSRRRRLIHRVAPEVVAWLDADSLDIRGLSLWPFRVDPVLYDPGTDQLFSPSTERPGLQALPAEALQAVTASPTEMLEEGAVEPRSFPLVVEGRIDPTVR